MKNYLALLVPAVLLAALGCSDGDTGNDVYEDTAPTDTVEDVSEADVSDTVQTDTDLELPPPEFDEILAGTLERMMLEHVEFSADPGFTMTVGTADGAWWSGAAGVKDLETDSPMLPDSQFRVGSNTKPIVAVILLQLVEEGLVELDEPLTTYLPGFTVWSDITVRMLLNMRSGLKEFLAIPACLLTVMLNPETAMTPAQVMQFVVDDTDNGRMFAPDTDGSYSNTNYVLLGMIIESVTGNTVDQEITDRILTPLGLEDTYLDLGEFDNTDIVQGYVDVTSAGAIANVRPADLALLPNLRYVDGMIVGTHLMHPTVTWASGSLVSTSADMGTFVRALMTGKLLKPQTMEQMSATQPAALLGGITEYGLGLQNVPTDEGLTWGHGGLNFGYQTQTWYLPEHGITISHIHNFLLNWYDAFQNEVVAMVRQGGDASYQPCQAPQDFYGDGTAGKVMNLAFKGVINQTGETTPEYGISRFRIVNEGQVKPSVGLLPAATREEKDGQQVITVLSYGLPATGEADLEMLTVQIGAGLFSDINADGTKTIALENSADMFIARTEISYAEGTKTPEKLCFTGFSEPTRDGMAYLCPSVRQQMPKAGDTLKIMATLPFSDDPDYINQIATAVLKTSVCSCLDGTVWGTCP